MTRALVVLYSTFIAFVMSACGSDPVEFAEIGSSCSREAATLCESPAGGSVAGPCLLDLPGGMCSYDCADDEGICPEGFVCGELSEGRFCLRSCDGDGDCEGGALCVLGECRGPQGEASGCEEDGDCAAGLLCVIDACFSPRPFGESCGEGADCSSGLCHEGACSARCGEQSDCDEGVTCVALSDGTSLCVDLAFGDDCDRDSECPSGICHDDRCNLECHDPWDCAAGLSCVDLGDGVPLCMEYEPPDVGEGEYGESCTFLDCATGFDCISRTEEREDDPYAYCTRSCLNDLECPAEMTCRRTHLPGEEDVVPRCVPRGYCERCAHDEQCGGGGARCVSQDPRRGPGRYCSEVCDPERPVSSCSTDSTCQEALWCAPERAWVADCEWCSDPEQCEEPEGDPIYQCFHDYGACSGSGDSEDYCAPCFVDEDCPRRGACRYDPYTANSFCTMRCPDDEEGGCPPEHFCQQFGLLFEQDYECMPRQGSCSQPSGGLTACWPCDAFGDCVSGFCIPEVDGGPSYCYVDCEDDPCPPYTECQTFEGTDGATFRLCAPIADLRGCSEARICIDDCPEGPDSCNSGARTYCL